MKKIGIAYDRPEDYPGIEGPEDRFAEFEPESTIIAMEEAITESGFIPIRLGGPHAILKQKPDVDIVWNIAEGYGTRNRESWVPVLCEMYGIPCLGSDAYTLSLSLDKMATREIALNSGIPVSPGLLIHDAKEIEDFNLRFPVFLKPNYEGTAKGIGQKSVANNLTELTEIAEIIIREYKQPVLVEEFLPGAEFTCAVMEHPLRCGPVLERGICATSGIGIHALEKDGIERDYRLLNTLTPEIEEKIHIWSLKICKAMNVRHFARLDFKCDSDGNPHFLEINPLPTFAIDSTYAIMAELENQDYNKFLGGILRKIVL